MKMWWYKVKRLWRLWHPSPAEKLFISTMGWWFMLRYRVKREYRIGQFMLDFALPQYRLAFEVDGGRYHKNTVRDYERDLLLSRKYGWEIYRIPARDLYQTPKEVRKGVLKAIRGH